MVSYINQIFIKHYTGDVRHFNLYISHNCPLAVYMYILLHCYGPIPASLQTNKKMTFFHQILPMDE